MAELNPYYTKLEYKEFYEDKKFLEIEIKLMSTDNYSDSEIMKSIKKTKKEKELFSASLQTSIVGFGNRTYGSVELEGQQINIKDLFQECGVYTNLTVNSKLDPHQLTPRRLHRFFRYLIKDYLKQNKSINTYLFKKYSSGVEEYRDICFSGGEHVVEDKMGAVFLFQTYVSLDLRLQTNIHERISRVFMARGLLNQKELNLMKQILESDTKYTTNFEELKNELQANSFKL